MQKIRKETVEPETEIREVEPRTRYEVVPESKPEEAESGKDVYLGSSVAKVVPDDVTEL